ncbi:calcium and integrin-binding protein 1 [Harpegnathos saltator]|uniref:Calcium and integrin-binding protein 1 n=1 Tax=Harpegnathos saltator TaxID=610380 RepID=E2BDG8_HARSA|nr:calcium and integrin-binding protein 1 [Harpegnathos saltator]EFN86280.1 Calcium and integrin-binding protein 1 [Harpegnathos saltator]
MGNWGSSGSVLSRQAVDEYVELTYLCKNEVRRIYKLLSDLEPEQLKQNLHYRFPAEQIDKVLPQIRCNPFRDSIYRVFSSQRDGCLSFEDTLDLCSAFSANCPRGIRAAWAFEIFDFDGDNEISLNDLIETVQRLTGTDERGQDRIDPQHAQDIARMILREMDLVGSGSIVLQEFVHMISKMPDFAHTFQFKVL